MVASPPGFISETKLFNFNSNGKGEININRTNKISNNIFIIYKDDFNMTDTFCLINNLKNITTTKPNNNISDTLYFTFGNNREDYLAPKMRGAP
jgi:hypothetical protein